MQSKLGPPSVGLGRVGGLCISWDLGPDSLRRMVDHKLGRRAQSSSQEFSQRQDETRSQMFVLRFELQDARNRWVVHRGERG